MVIIFWRGRGGGGAGAWARGRPSCSTRRNLHLANRGGEGTRPGIEFPTLQLAETGLGASGFDPKGHQETTSGGLLGHAEQIQKRVVFVTK